jgi:hypothetical protein
VAACRSGESRAPFFLAGRGAGGDHRQVIIQMSDHLAFETIFRISFRIR